MAALLTSIGDLITAVFDSWVPLVITAITENPILILFVAAVPLMGAAIGIFNRLVRSN